MGAGGIRCPPPLPAAGDPPRVEPGCCLWSSMHCRRDSARYRRSSCKRSSMRCREGRTRCRRNPTRRCKRNPTCRCTAWEGTHATGAAAAWLRGVRSTTIERPRAPQATVSRSAEEAHVWAPARHSPLRCPPPSRPITPSPIRPHPPSGGTSAWAAHNGNSMTIITSSSAAAAAAAKAAAAVRLGT